MDPRDIFAHPWNDMTDIKVQTTLAAETATEQLGADLRLLKASIVAMRNGSPDDTHMGNRLAWFLEIMLNASYQNSRQGSPTGTRQDPSAFAAANGGRTDISEGPRGMMASVAGLDLPDLVRGLGNIDELVDWSDGPFDTLGLMGFLPNP